MKPRFILYLPGQTYHCEETTIGMKSRASMTFVRIRKVYADGSVIAY